MYIRRTIEKEFKNLGDNFKVILTSGMRQIGKSTLMQHLAEPDRACVTLDSQRELETASRAPEAFFRQHPLPVFIDEIQRAPALFLQIKAEVDKSEECGRVWISGSQRFSLMRGVGDSLAGRLCEVRLMPLSLYERQGQGLLQNPYLPNLMPSTALTPQSLEETWRIIWQGAWPKVLNYGPKLRDQFFDALLTTFIERDIRELCQIGDIRQFSAFVKALAIRTGQELRLNTLAQIAQVAVPTVKRWLSLAQTLGLIYLLSPFSTNKSKSLIKSPKLYFTDTGLAAWLCGFTTPQELSRDMNAGAFFETFVVMEILKSWRHNGTEPRLFFYRDQKGLAEIDLLIHADGKWHPVEIKTTKNPDSNMVRHFGRLADFGLPLGTGALICNTPVRRYIADNVVAHSVWEL